MPKESQYALLKYKSVYKVRKPTTASIPLECRRHRHYRLKHSEPIIAALLSWIYDTVSARLLPKTLKQSTGKYLRMSAIIVKDLT